MKREELKEFLSQPLRYLTDVKFSAIKKKQFPKPLDALRSTKFKASNWFSVGQGQYAVFVLKNSDVLEQRSIFGWLFREVSGRYEPLVRMDYHCSHKNLHAKLNCDSPLDLIGRNLVQCKEFDLTKPDRNLRASGFDPDDEQDQKRFVHIFCERFGIELKSAGNGISRDIGELL
jgi:hypothetical protein